MAGGVNQITGWNNTGRQAYANTPNLFGQPQQPQQPATQSFQLPQSTIGPQTTQSQQQVNGGGMFAPALAAMPMIGNTKTPNLPTQSAQPQPAQTAQQQQATPVAPKSVVTPNTKQNVTDLINQSFSYAPAFRGGATPGFLGTRGGLMPSIAGGYNANTMRESAYSNPDKFISEGQKYWNSANSAADPMQFNEVVKGLTPGMDVVYRNMPDYLKQQIMNYNKEPEAPAVVEEAKPQQNVEPTQDLTGNTNSEGNEVVPDFLTQIMGQYNDYYNQISQGYQSQIDSLSSMISNLSGGSSGDSLTELITPKDVAIKRPYEMARPQGLDFLEEGMSDLQRRTALATQATQGGGIDKQGESYFLNSLLRNLISDSGSMGQLEDSTPTEQQYLQMLGYNTSDEQAFLRALKDNGIYAA